MSNDPAHVIAQAIAESRAILHDHLESGVGSPVDVLARANKVLSQRADRALRGAGRPSWPVRRRRKAEPAA